MNINITSRQRVKLAIDHKEADRVPIDFGAMRSTGISTIAYNRLRKNLGINKGMSRMYDFYQQLAYPEKKVRDLFHVDTIDAGQAFMVSDDDWKNWILKDGSDCLIPKYVEVEIDKSGAVLHKNKDGIVLARKPGTSLYLNQVHFPLKDMSSIPEDVDLERLYKSISPIPIIPWHLDIYDDNQYKEFTNTIKKFYKETDYFIMLEAGCSLFHEGFFFRGMDNFLCDVYTDKKRTKKFLDKLVDRYLKLLDRVLSSLAEYVDCLWFGDDFGSQGSIFMSPDVFEDVFKPRYKKMWDFVHSKSDCKVFFHSCGSIYEIIHHLIDAGLDVLNPVQTTAKGMEPEKLKREFGKDITFWGGGCNTRDILPYASPKEIKEDVKKRISIFAEGGGFVFNQIHNILADVPPENIIAMFEAACEYGITTNRTY